MIFNSHLKTFNEIEFQRETKSFVQQQVICCVSTLMATLIEWGPCEQFYDFFGTFLRYDEDDNPIEIFEYWFVSKYLAEKLDAKGEIVASVDYFGHYVWGRTTTGQSISIDNIIREIYLEL